MPSEIESILADCVTADPSLKGRENELRTVIAAMLKAKPDTRFDETFALRLRNQLAHNPPPTPMRKLSPFALLIPAGALAAVLLAVVLSPQHLQAPTADNGNPAMTAAHSQVIALGDEAFGSLSTATSVAPEGADASTGNALRTQSGGGGPTGTPAPMVATDSKMMPIDYVPTNYRYVYDGEPLTLEPVVNVYRRVRGFDDTAAAAGLLAGLNGGLADLSRLQSTQVQSFSIAENRDFGYSVYVDTVDGNISMSQNYSRWPHPENDCRDEACFNQYRLSPSDVPADDEVIRIADAFLSDYGVSREPYGDPVVNSQWRSPMILRASISAEPPAAAPDMYVPDVITVTYPLKIDGTAVSDDAGMPSGLTVNVNVRQHRVDGMWGLATANFQKSSYAAETDASRILSVLEKGGVYGGWFDGAEKTVEVKVGAPELVLRRSWVNGPNGTSDELLVPSLRFPVLTPPPGMEWRTSIVVPLAKEQLDEMNQPLPVPLMNPAATTEGAAAPSIAPSPAPEPRPSLQQ